MLLRYHAMLDYLPDMLSAEQQMVDMVGRILAESASVLSGMGGAVAAADPQPNHVRPPQFCWFFKCRGDALSGTWCLLLRHRAASLLAAAFRGIPE